LASAGNLRYYEPDFVAFRKDGAHYIAETKGLEAYKHLQAVRFEDLLVLDKKGRPSRTPFGVVPRFAVRTTRDAPRCSWLEQKTQDGLLGRRKLYGRVNHGQL